MVPQQKKILVIQTAFIGDAILATSVLEELHTHDPFAELHLLVRKGNESLFHQHPFIKKVWVWNKKTKKYKHLLELIKTVRKEKFDMVVNLQRFMSTGLIAAFSKAKIKTGFDKNPLSFLYTHSTTHRYHRHETERNHELVQFYTHIAIAKPKLYPTNEDMDAVKKYQAQPYITIAPASVWFTKQFPAEKWIEFLASIHQPMQVFLLGGSSDVGLCKQIKEQVKNSQLRIEILAGEYSFLQTAALMNGARMNYVNDSAPLHIASAMNAPVRAIFCSTVKEFGFGPLSDDGKIIETPMKLFCRPCSIHGKKACPLGHFNCAMSIQIPAIE